MSPGGPGPQSQTLWNQQARSSLSPAYHVASRMRPSRWTWPTPRLPVLHCEPRSMLLPQWLPSPATAPRPPHPHPCRVVHIVKLPSCQRLLSLAHCWSQLPSAPPPRPPWLKLECRRSAPMCKRLFILSFSTWAAIALPSAVLGQRLPGVDVYQLTPCFLRGP